MNTEITAMQEFIEWLLQENELLMPKTKMIIVGKADSLLAKERRHLIDAYHINPKESKYGNVGVDYYNETFKK